VADTGVGIPADQQGRVFERFHRVQDTQARTAEGTGIGLSLVRDYARLHGGDATLTSTRASGRPSPSDCLVRQARRLCRCRQGPRW
jgi:signal transduction histidine kinase